MKVICAGTCKTGTKTMAAALQELGYSVYDYMDHYNNLGHQWERIFETGGSTDDFRRMYSNVDAVTDLPACTFWQEIHEAFPESKIILMTRENEEIWWKSMERQMETEQTFTMRMYTYLSPTLRRYYRFMGKLMICTFLWDETTAGWFGKNRFNELMCKLAYRSHNANVIQNAPKDKFLQFSVKEGWGPLCHFLGKEVPSKPFPHKNKGGEFTDEMFKGDPTMARARREIYCSYAILSALGLFGAYKLATGSSPLGWIKCCISAGRNSLKFVGLNAIY